MEQSSGDVFSSSKQYRYAALQYGCAVKAKDSLSRIGEIVKSSKRYEFDIITDRFDLKLVVNALGYQLLRLTQALTATGDSLISKKEQKVINTKNQQIVNMDTINLIRDQLLYGKCSSKKILELSETIANSPLSNHLNALLKKKMIAEMPVQIQGASLQTVLWKDKFSDTIDQNEKENEEKRLTILKYILSQLDFMKSLSKPIAPNLREFSLGGIRIDAMKMCLIKVKQCTSLLNHSEKPVEDDISDSSLLEFVINLDQHKRNVYNM